MSSLHYAVVALRIDEMNNDQKKKLVRLASRDCTTRKLTLEIELVRLFSKGNRIQSNE